MALDQWHNNFNETPQWLFDFDIINDQWLDVFPGDIFVKFKFIAGVIKILNMQMRGKNIKYRSIRLWHTQIFINGK